MDSVDLEVLKRSAEWLDAGRRVLLVTVVKTWGSSPRPEGAMLAVRDDGLVVGSVSGGCIEDDIIDRTRRLGMNQTVRRDGDLRRLGRRGAPLRAALRRARSSSSSSRSPKSSGMRALLREIEAGHLVARRLDSLTGEATLHPAQAVDGLALRRRDADHHPRSALSHARDRRVAALEVPGADRRRPRLPGHDLRPARGIHRDVGHPRRHARAHDARRHGQGDAPRRALRGRGAHARSQARRPGAHGGAQVAGVLRRRAGLARQQREAPRATAASST